MKKCTRCGIEKARSGFSKDRKAKDGLSSQCRSCHAEHYQDNRTEKLEYQRIYYPDNRTVEEQHELSVLVSTYETVD